MKIFITGVTGYIGQKLALRLAADGHTIHALVRNVEKGRLLLKHPNITLFEGDILNATSLLTAMKGCHQVYHLAALASVWHKDPQSFHMINVSGLRNVLDACLASGIKDVLFTSTAGVVGDSVDGNPVCEGTNVNPKLETLYEKSKVEAEKLLKSYIPKGIRGVIVNPSRVYGPGILTESNGFTRLMKMYINGQWKIKPCNGKSIGNYVYIDDTINGLIAAMEKAKPGERYLLGGVNATYNDFFSLVDELTGVKRKNVQCSIAGDAVPVACTGDDGSIVWKTTYDHTPVCTQIQQTLDRQLSKSRTGNRLYDNAFTRWCKQNARLA